MAVSLKPSHLKRYKDIAVLLVKYGRGDLATRLDVEGELSPGGVASVPSETPTNFRILGYPGLAILFFLAAALGGVALVVSILASDRRPPERKRTH